MMLMMPTMLVMPNKLVGIIDCLRCGASAAASVVALTILLML